MRKEKVCIVGLGWLGLPLYRRLASVGMEVVGTKRSAAAAAGLRDAGMHAHPMELDGESALEVGDWFGGEFLVINIPPGRKQPDVRARYPKQIQQLLYAAKKQKIKHVIFVSSTSVFGGSQGQVGDEDALNPTTDSGRALAECERYVTDAGGATVRFGGLYGPGRHPGRFFAGRSEAPEGDAPVNFIHQDDAVGVIKHVMDHFETGLRINAVAPTHPPKKDFYHRAALDYGVEPPRFLPGGEDGKYIRCEWLETTAYTFQHPNLDFSGCGGKSN